VLKNDPIVITGYGVLACNGLGREAYWDALKNGRSGIGPITRFDASPYPCQIAGELPDFDPIDFMSKGDARRWHRHTHMAIAAASMAIEDADLESAGYADDRISAGFGTSAGEPDEYYMRHRKQWEEGGWRKINRLASSASSGHAVTVQVSVKFGLRGPATTLASGCATGLDVIAWGTNILASGRADAAVVGATESPLTELMLAATCSLGILTKRNDNPAGAMRPFDRESDGLALSEGSGAVVLERESRAKARGARIYGRIAGYSNFAEGMSALSLDPEGKALAKSIQGALKNAAMAPDDLDAAVCHGVSLRMYDRSETEAYKRALGEAAYRIPLSAPKSMTGQPYSAGGMLSVGAALLALDQGVVSPNINLDEPDPECDLDYVPKKARMNDVDNTLVTALSFGGTHSALILRSTS
jgi:3-oxoacyl-[acyl-carrier-protein] synthase II